MMKIMNKLAKTVVRMAAIGASALLLAACATSQVQQDAGLGHSLTGWELPRILDDGTEQYVKYLGRSQHREPPLACTITISATRVDYAYTARVDDVTVRRRAFSPPLMLHEDIVDFVQYCGMPPDHIAKKVAAVRKKYG